MELSYEDKIDQWRKTRTCGSKLKFVTRKQAKTRLREANMNLKDGGRMRVYRCKYCDHYHMGHNKFANSD